VPEPVKLEKAQLQELDATLEDVAPGAQPVPVQFNPETLKLSFANQVQQPQSGGSSNGQQSRQFVGTGTTKLALQLWLDVTAQPYSDQGLTDVRELTSKVTYFMTPKPADGAAGGSGGGGSSQQTQLIPPGVRFAWGTFQFDGVMDQLEESLEFFSPDGKPLRASVSMTLSQQKIFNPEVAAGRRPSGGPGTSPLTAAPQGSSLPQLAANAGAAAAWQSIASANGIEDPLRLQPGQLVDLNRRAGAGA
jgi:hypothetical protein